MENMKLFPQGLYVLSSVGAILLTLWATRFWIRWSLRHEWLDKPGHRKIHTQPIPLAGGLGIATSMACILTGGILLAWLGGLPDLARDALEYGYSSRGSQILGIGFGALSMLVIGLWDDQKQPSPAPKFLAQVCVALMVTASGVRITLFMEAAWLHYLITCFWILLIVNACNFVDNMNGLCSGLATISALFFAIHAMSHDHYLVASLAWAIAGAIAGFLPFNYPKAKAFLGDAGSHLIGFLIAIMAILPHFYSEESDAPWVVLAPIPILGVFLIDLAWVVGFRWMHGLPVYQGDTNHLSHQLVRRGCSPAAAVALLWMLQCLLGCLSIWMVRP